MWVGVRVGGGVGVGVDFSKLESESESESLKFARLRSPAFDACIFVFSIYDVNIRLACMYKLYLHVSCLSSITNLLCAATFSSCMYLH